MIALAENGKKEIDEKLAELKVQQEVSTAKAKELKERADQTMQEFVSAQQACNDIQVKIIEQEKLALAASQALSDLKRAPRTGTPRKRKSKHKTMDLPSDALPQI